MPCSIIISLPYSLCNYFVLCNAIVSVPTARVSSVLGGVFLYYTINSVIFLEGVPQVYNLSKNCLSTSLSVGLPSNHSNSCSVMQRSLSQIEIQTHRYQSKQGSSELSTANLLCCGAGEMSSRWALRCHSRALAVPGGLAWSCRGAGVELAWAAALPSSRGAGCAHCALLSHCWGRSMRQFPNFPTLPLPL